MCIYIYIYTHKYKYIIYVCVHACICSNSACNFLGFCVCCGFWIFEFSELSLVFAFFAVFEFSDFFLDFCVGFCGFCGFWIFRFFLGFCVFSWTETNLDVRLHVLKAKYWWEDCEEGDADGKYSHDIPRLTFWGSARYDHEFVQNDWLL